MDDPNQRRRNQKEDPSVVQSRAHGRNSLRVHLDGVEDGGAGETRHESQSEKTKDVVVVDVCGRVCR